MASKLTIGGVIVGVILVTILLSAVAALYPTFESAGNEINDTDMPLASLFESGAVIGLVFAAMVVLGVLAYFKLRT